MNPLYNTILEDIKKAMRSRDESLLRVLRSLKSKIMEKEISERKGGNAKLSEEQVVEVLMKASKQRKDSIHQFSEAGRNDLAESELFELNVIKSYLPEMLSEGDIREKALQAIKETGASSSSDMGKVMGSLMPEVKGKADGALVNRIVRELLG